MRDLRFGHDASSNQRDRREQFLDGIRELFVQSEVMNPVPKRDGAKTWVDPPHHAEARLLLLARAEIELPARFKHHERV